MKNDHFAFAAPGKQAVVNDRMSQAEGGPDQHKILDEAALAIGEDVEGEAIDLALGLLASNGDEVISDMVAGIAHRGQTDLEPVDEVGGAAGENVAMMIDAVARVSVRRSA